MDSFDCHIFADKTCVSAHGFIKVGYWKTNNCDIELDESLHFIIRSSSLKKWSNILTKFCRENSGSIAAYDDFVPDEFFSTNTLIKVTSDQLSVETKTKDVWVTFTKAEVKELLFGLSHLFFGTLGIPVQTTLVFSEIISYYETFPIEDWQQTRQTIKNTEISDIILLIENICSKLQISQNALKIYLTLKRFENFFSVLFCMRIIKKIK
jgi:hypothetical protein